MGPNGTGKSTLSAAIMGNPNYEVTKGEVLFDGVNILSWKLTSVRVWDFSLLCNTHQKFLVLLTLSFLRAAMNAGKEDDEKISDS